VARQNIRNACYCFLDCSLAIFLLVFLFLLTSVSFYTCDLIEFIYPSVYPFSRRRSHHLGSSLLLPNCFFLFLVFSHPFSTLDHRASVISYCISLLHKTRPSHLGCRLHCTHQNSHFNLKVFSMVPQRGKHVKCKVWVAIGSLWPGV
jgi:hypothetical protein